MTLYEILASGEFSGETILKFPTKPIFFEKSCEIPQIEFYRFAPESVVFPMTFIAKNFDYPEKPLKYKHIRRISD